jgi:hypothetical protein
MLFKVAEFVLHNCDKRKKAPSICLITPIILVTTIIYQDCINLL